MTAWMLAHPRLVWLIAFAVVVVALWVSERLWDHELNTGRAKRVVSNGRIPIQLEGAPRLRLLAGGRR